MKLINAIKDLFTNTAPSSANAPKVSHSRFNEIIVPDRMEPAPQSLYDPSKDGRPDNTIAYFKNGELYNVYPRNKRKSLDEDSGVAYRARYIVSDGVKYDLYDPESIKQIKIPSFNKISGIPYLTRDMGYLLRMCAANELRTHLTVPLVYKAINLMIASPIHYTKKDYFRMVAHLWTLGEIKYGDYLLDELKGKLPVMAAADEVKFVHNNAFSDAINAARRLNTNYLEIGYLGAVCQKCAPFQNRVYSISGKDKRFPSLPSFILESKGLHCSPSYCPFTYYEGRTLTQYIYKSNGEVCSKEVDAIKYSNRPFVDDRCRIEIDNYNSHLAKEEKRGKADDTFYNREHWIQKYYCNLEYNQIVDKLGSKAPKSLNGYIKMKNSNSANYQKLVKLAEENGIMIS